MREMIHFLKFILKKFVGVAEGADFSYHEIPAF